MASAGRSRITLAAVTLNYFAYNFCTIHTSLRVTPAIAASVADSVMDMSDLITMLVESESDKAA
jgi:hypothetical protein